MGWWVWFFHCGLQCQTGSPLFSGSVSLTYLVDLPTMSRGVGQMRGYPCRNLIFRLVFSHPIILTPPRGTPAVSLAGRVGPYWRGRLRKRYPLQTFVHGTPERHRTTQGRKQPKEGCTPIAEMYHLRDDHAFVRNDEHSVFNERQESCPAGPFFPKS